MAVIVNGDGILTGVSSLTTALDDITSGRGTITGVTTVGTLQLGAGVSISSPRSQNAAIFTNNSEFLTVDDAGRVGVGTVTPNSDAHPQNVGKINVGFITARSVAGDIDANTLVVAGLSTFTGAIDANGGLVGNVTGNASGSSGSCTGNSVTATTSTNVTVADESSDTTCFPLFVTAASGNLPPKSGSNLTFNSSSGNLRTGSLFLGTGSNESKTQDGLIMERNSGDGAVHITAGRSGGNYSGLQFYVAGASGVTLRHNIDYQGNFIWYDEDGSTEMVRIHNNGNFGINDTSPSSKLVVRDTTGSISATKTLTANFYRNDGTRNPRLQILHNQDGSIIRHTYSTGASSLIFELGTTEIARFNGSGNLAFASGKGIDFAATANSSGTTSSELLDDYEEGSWVPNVYNAGSSSNWTAKDGDYQKVGNTVTVWMRVDGGTTPRSGGSVGHLTIDGLPFAISGMDSNTVLGIGAANFINTGSRDINISTSGSGNPFVRIGGSNEGEQCNYFSACFTYKTA